MNDYMIVRSYCVTPGVRGQPKLVVVGNNTHKEYSDYNTIITFLAAARSGAPFRARRFKKTTPTGGEYYAVERVDKK